MLYLVITNKNVRMLPKQHTLVYLTCLFTLPSAHKSPIWQPTGDDMHEGVPLMI